jgi:hypothetical protein
MTATATGTIALGNLFAFGHRGLRERYGNGIDLFRFIAALARFTFGARSTLPSRLARFTRLPRLTCFPGFTRLPGLARLLTFGTPFNFHTAAFDDGATILATLASTTLGPGFALLALANGFDTVGALRPLVAVAAPLSAVPALATLIAFITLALATIGLPGCRCNDRLFLFAGTEKIGQPCEEARLAGFVCSRCSRSGCSGRSHWSRCPLRRCLAGLDHLYDGFLATRFRFD